MKKSTFVKRVKSELGFLNTLANGRPYEIKRESYHDKIIILSVLSTLAKSAGWDNKDLGWSILGDWCEKLILDVKHSWIVEFNL